MQTRHRVLIHKSLDTRSVPQVCQTWHDCDQLGEQLVEAGEAIGYSIETFIQGFGWVNDDDGNVIVDMRELEMEAVA